jgi:PilZ domain
MALSGDRRKRQRVALHWPVRLFGQHGRASVESITENLSTEGLYCISTMPFKTGERLRCEIVIPKALGSDAPIVLDCHVTVRRVVYLRSGFGVGCHIEDYSLSSGEPPQSG